MAVLDGNCAVGCGPGTGIPQNLYISMYARTTDEITKEFLETITFVLAYLTLFGRM
jgi:hypothetical protein